MKSRPMPLPTKKKPSGASGPNAIRCVVVAMIVRDAISHASDNDPYYAR